MGTLQRIALAIIRLLFFLIMVWLVYTAGFSTAFLSQSESTWLLRDSFVRNVIALVLAVVFGVVILRHSHRFDRLKEKVNRDRAVSDHWRRICLRIIACEALLFIIVTHGQPTADQLYIQQTASQFLDREYFSFAPGGYVNRFPYQLGIILVLYGLSLVFGSFNSLAFEIANAAALVLIYKGLAEMSDESGRSNMEGLFIIASGIFFLPGIFYAGFSYGTLIGLCCGVNAAKHLLRYRNTHRIRDLVWLGILSLSAMVFKTNDLIFLIAMIVAALVMMLGNRDVHQLLAIAVIVAAIFGTTPLVNGVTTAVTGQVPSSGSSSLSSIAMGLQEGEGRYYGWYNHYNWDSYTSSGYDTAIQKEAAAEYIQQRLAAFREDPSMAVRFFAGKNASQWNNPTYEGVWIEQVMDRSIVVPYYIQYLLSEQGSRTLTMILAIPQFLLFAFALFSVFFRRRTSDSALFYAGSIIGGFLFYSFWEAKCQYTLPFVFLMIPLAVEGYRDLVFFVSKIPSCCVKQKRLAAAGLLVFAGFGGLIHCERIPLLNDLFLSLDDTDAFESYVASKSWIRVADGDYVLSGEIDGVRWYISEADDGTEESEASVGIMSRQPDVMRIYTSYQSDTIFIENRTSGNCLTVEGEPEDGKSLSFAVQNDEPSQDWQVRKSAADGRINIVFRSSWALTYDQENASLYLSQLRDTSDQQWTLVPMGQ